MPFATACCGIELMATGASRHDIARFGAEAMRFSPRQCDLMIVAGRVVMKMLPVLQRIWLQMPEPKWCISMGACASSGGVFDTYAVVQGIDRFIPVDVYVPGCPPRPEQLLSRSSTCRTRSSKTGTITGKEFCRRIAGAEGPLAGARCTPADAMVAPGDFDTGDARLRGSSASAISGSEQHDPRMPTCLTNALRRALRRRRLHDLGVPRQPPRHRAAAARLPLSWSASRSSAASTCWPS